MIDINNKDFRKCLIDKYLKAETSIFEERLLADYYLGSNNIDEDERAIAETVRMEHMYDSILSNAGVEEFDRMVNETKRKNKPFVTRFILTVSGMAASIALFLMIYPIFSHKAPETVEIAQCIRLVMELEAEEIVSVTATPISENVWINAELQSGETKTFIMSNDKERGTTSLLAVN